MLITILIVSLIAAVSLHELGHAYAMRECGVPIERICLIGWGTKYDMITLPFTSKIFPGAKLVVHPLFIGAYVKPDENAMRAISDKDEMYISGMGPYINFMFAGVLFGCMLAASAVFALGGFFGSIVALSTLIATAGVTWILWSYRRFFCEYILLPIGIVFLVIAANYLIGLTFKEWQYLSGGPLSFFVMLGRVASRVPENPVHVVWFIFKFAASMSLFLALLNLIPIPPLDGGRMVLRWLKRLVSERMLGLFQRFGNCLVLALLVLALHNDLAVIDGFFGFGWLHF